MTFIRKDIWDVGTIIERYLKVARKSYLDVFNGREFRYNLQDKLAGGVGVTWGSRHSQLINKTLRKFIFAIYFPSALQGLSIDASLEFISSMPRAKKFILSGLDVFVAMTTYPDILARDWNTPSIVMSGLLRQIQMHSKEFSNFTPFFKAFNDSVNFSKMSNASFASGARSCGITFIG